MTILGQLFTKTDKTIGGWVIDDEVVQLREWGAPARHRLPRPPIDELTVGADPACGLRLEDPSGRVSRLHARLVRDEASWLLLDEGSKNGVWVDGCQRHKLTLSPGQEIAIGGFTLIAESPRSIAFHNFLARLLGWGTERLRYVDHALHAVRMAATCGVALVLCGDGDLVPVAYSIHRRSRGSDRPFVVCDPRREPGKVTTRSAENRTTGREALAAAAGGSLCVRTRRLPADFSEVVQALSEHTSRIQLVVCAEAAKGFERCRVTPIEIPPLTGRPREIDRIIDEYAHDAMVELATPRSVFQAIDHAWVREHAAGSLPEIEKATLRLVALRASRNLSQAAARLGMAPVSLSRWIDRRSMPMEIVK